MSLLDFITRGAQNAVQRGRGLLDDFTQPGIEATPGEVVQGTQRLAPGVNPAMAPEGLGYGENGPVTDVGPMMRPDVIRQKPSLLSELGSYVTSRDGLMALGAGIKGLSGDDNAGFEVAQMQRQRAADAERMAEKAKAKAEAQAEKQRQQALNQAFWDSFNEDGSFNRARYAQVARQMGGMADPRDFTEALTAGRAAGPKYGISGGVAYTQDQDTGETTWGEMNPVKEAEQARQKAMDAFNQEQSRIRTAIAQGQLSVAQGRLALQQAAHKARLAAGGYGTPGVGAAGGGISDDDVEVDQ